MGRFIWIFLIVLSCQDYKKEEFFTVTMDVVMKDDDSIHVFYKSDGTVNFIEEESIWKNVKGSDKNQKISIVFPKHVMPNQIRIDFGRNKKQNQVILNKIQLERFGNGFSADGKEIYKLFRIDTSNTSLNKDTGVLTRKDSLSQGLSLYPNGYYLAVKLEELKYKNK